MKQECARRKGRWNDREYLSGRDVGTDGMKEGVDAEDGRGVYGEYRQ